MSGNQPWPTISGSISYIINLGADSNLTTSTVTINNTTPGVELLINGADFTINGQNIYNVRPFTIASGTVVTMDAIMLTGRYIEQGGAIRNAGQLALTNSTLRGNRACVPFFGVCETGYGGAIFNAGGTIDISMSTISENMLGNTSNIGGGAIYNTNNGTVNIVHSRLTDNDVGVDGYGGAIYNESGAIYLESSLINGNYADRLGGAIQNKGTLLVSNSTISGNRGDGDGGALHNWSSGIATIINSTIIDNRGANGGGIYNQGQLTLHNTIVSGNRAIGIPIRGEEIFNGGTITVDGNNLFGDSDQTTALSLRNFTPGSSDIVATSDGTQPTALSDILDTTLQNNGGDTETHALVVNSLAVNTGANALAVNTAGNPLISDQRGAEFPRIVGGTVDIGAYESAFLPNNAPVASDDAYNTDEGTQLDEAAPGVLGNDSNADGDTLTAVLMGNVSNGTLTLNADGSFTVNATTAPFATCGGYAVFETTPGVYSAPGFPGNLLVGTNDYDWLIGTDGPDLILGLQGPDDLWGGDGDDVICGGAGVDIILGMKGNDTLYGDDQPDWLIGGPDNDTLFGGEGWDDLQGDSGHDTLHGEGGSNVLLGGSADDNLFGGDEPDALFGQNGNDNLDGGGADDYCRGGRGSDTITNCEPLVSLALTGLTPTVSGRFLFANDDVDAFSRHWIRSNPHLNTVATPSRDDLNTLGRYTACRQSNIECGGHLWAAVLNLF